MPAITQKCKNSKQSPCWLLWKLRTITSSSPSTKMAWERNLQGKKSFSLNGKHLPKFTNWKKALMIENTIIYLIYSVGEFYCVRIDSFVLLLSEKSILFTLYLKIYSVFSRWYNNVFQQYSIYLTEAQPTRLILLSILEISTGIIHHLLLRKTYQLSSITSYFQWERVFKLKSALPSSAPDFCCYHLLATLELRVCEGHTRFGM